MIERHFAASDDLESIITFVKRSAAEECAAGACPVYSSLESCARDAVSRLEESRIKTFVPLLAPRHVRCCIRAGRCGCGDC
jgi:hypothetical protein